MKAPLLLCLLSLASAAALAGAHPGSEGMAGGDRFKDADRDGDGRISREEAQQAAAARAERWFERSDRDKDGFVTAEELREGWEARRAAVRQKAEERFEAADTDGDGAVSKAEAQAGMPVLERSFDAIDADKDGRITQEELRAHRESMRPARPPAR